MFLSKLGYSELVQRLFEKMTFFLVATLKTMDAGDNDDDNHDDHNGATTTTAMMMT